MPKGISGEHGYRHVRRRGVGGEGINDGDFHLKGHRGLPDGSFSLDLLDTLFPLQNKGNPVYRSLLPA